MPHKEVGLHMICRYQESVFSNRKWTAWQNARSIWGLHKAGDYIRKHSYLPGVKNSQLPKARFDKNRDQSTVILYFCGLDELPPGPSGRYGRQKENYDK